MADIIQQAGQGVVLSLKKATDASGLLNLAKLSTLLTTDFQLLNQFEVLFYPSDFDSLKPSDAFKSIIGENDAIIPLFIKSIQGITLPTLEMEDINGIKHVKGITHPEEIIMEFIETEVGSVRTFIQKWINRIYLASSPLGNASSGFSNINVDVNSEGNSFYYTFRDNQAAAKKNALITFKGSLNAPTLGGWLKLEGLKIKTATGFELAQGAEEIMTIVVTMSVDTVKFVTPLSQGTGVI